MYHSSSRICDSYEQGYEWYINIPGEKSTQQFKHGSYNTVQIISAGSTVPHYNSSGFN